MVLLRKLTAVVLGFASIFVTLYAFIAFIGQVFFGIFSPVATVGSLSALGAVFGAAACAGRRWCGVLIALLCLAAIASVFLEALDYYRHHDIPGNYFGWGLRVPFVLCLALIGGVRLFEYIHGPHNSLERTREE